MLFSSPTSSSTNLTVETRLEMKQIRKIATIAIKSKDKERGKLVHTERIIGKTRVLQNMALQIYEQNNSFGIAKSC